MDAPTAAPRLPDLGGLPAGQVFPVATSFPKDRSVTWGGQDLDEFLAMHRKVGGLLYVHERRPVPRVELAFLREGMFHVFEVGRQGRAVNGIRDVGLGIGL